MHNPEQPSLSLLVKLGSIVVHTDEMMTPRRHAFDVITVRSLLSDPEVQEWIVAMGPLLPVKRSS